MDTFTHRRPEPDVVARRRNGAASFSPDFAIWADTEARALPDDRSPKLSMPRQGFSIPRPRLRALMVGLAGGGVITLVAGPGYGKTATMADLLNSWEHASAYLALDEDDRDPERLVLLLAQMIDAVCPGAADRIERVLSSGDSREETCSEAEGLLLDELRSERSRGIALGFDDLHSIEGSSAEKLLGRFLAACPAEWLVLASSRKRLTLDLGFRATQGRILDLGARRLRLTPTEVAVWARNAWGLELSHTDARAVWRMTEGWPVALVLAGAHLGRRGQLPTKSRLLGLSRHGRQLSEYLAREFFSSQEPATAEFFMESFPLERVVFPRDGVLFSCGADSAERLCEELVDGGFLVARTGHRTYAMHRLVRDFAESRARATHPDSAASHLARAASHLESAGEPRTALALYLRSGRLNLATGVLRALMGASPNVAQVIARPEWLALLPPEAVRDEPWLLTLRARLLQDRGEWREAEPTFAGARRHFEQLGERSGVFHAAQGQAFCLYLLGRYDECLSALTRAEAMCSGAEERAEINVNIGSVLLGLCRWDDAVERFELALIGASRERRQALETRIAGHRARLFLLRGRHTTASEWAVRAVRMSSGQSALSHATMLNTAATLGYLSGSYEEARAQAEAARALIKTRGLAFLDAPSRLTLAGIRMGTGDFRGAVELLRDSLEASVQAGDMEAAVWAEDMLAQLCRCNRNPRRALEHHARALQLIDDNSLSEADRSRVVCGIGMDLCAAGRAEEAMPHLRKAEESSRRLSFEASLSQALFYVGWLHARAGDEGQASRALGEALRLAQTNRYVHFYRLEARVATPILALCARFGVDEFIEDEVLPGLSQRRVHYYRMLADGPTYPTDVPLGVLPPSRLAPTPPTPVTLSEQQSVLHGAFDRLTSRELEILLMVAEGLPNKVVASRLFITEKTIKTHTNNIYRKLGVSNRLQAVLRYQDYQRLPTGNGAARHSDRPPRGS